MKTIHCIHRLLPLLLGPLLTACPAAEPASPSPEAPQAPGSREARGVEKRDAEVLVTVNGRPITRDDLQQVVSRNPRARGLDLSPRQERNLLEALVGQELLAQAAAELKLDDAPQIQRQLQKKQAELEALRRRLLSKQMVAHLGTERVTVTDAELRAYFEENEAQVGFRFQVHQILRRRPEEIETVRKKLAAGETFEALATEGFADLPAAAKKPWDLGLLRWTQLPDPWRPVLAELPVGAISEVISTDRRHWILKLVARERDPEATFETLQPTLRTALLRTRTAQKRRTTEAALRAKAEIVFAPDVADLPERR